MQKKSEKLLESILKYYNSNNGCNLKCVKSIVDVSGSQSEKVSLRLIDWLVTNYSKSHNITYILNGKHFNIHQNYKDMLKAYSKKMFDPFRRHERIYIDCSSAYIYNFETTVAQLTFFRWAIESNIIEYAMKNRIKIKQDMDASVKQRSQKGGRIKSTQGNKRRSELSKSKVKSACIYRHPINVNF